MNETARWMLWLWPRPEDGDDVRLPADAAPAVEAASLASQHRDWALALSEFSPEVYVLDVGLAVDGATVLRYWGGWSALWQGVRSRLQALAQATQCAPPRLGFGATVWQARACALLGRVAPVDELPLWTLPQSAAHQTVWESLGLRTWGDLRRLPRGSVARRWGRDVLQGLDQACGVCAHGLSALLLAARFDARVQAPGVVGVEGLSVLVDELLERMAAWLRVRQQWAQSLRWTLHLEVPQLQVQQGRQAQQVYVIGSAQASAQAGLWRGLMRQHMTRWRLSAPVLALQLEVVSQQAVHAENRGLWDGPRGVELPVWIDGIKARWGGQGVALPRLCAQRLPERMQQWQTDLPPQPVAQTAPAQDAALAPPWLLRQPLALWVRDERPWYQGPLRLVLGPQRLDVLPWAADWCNAPQAQRREYFVACSPQAGWLWVFRQRADAQTQQPHWFLHGIYG